MLSNCNTIYMSHACFVGEDLFIQKILIKYFLKLQFLFLIYCYQLTIDITGKGLLLACREATEAVGSV